MLRDPATLDTLLDCIMDHAESKGYRISVKTRIGVHSTDEFPRILETFEKYPMKKLIVHARCRDDYYEGSADLARFAETVSDCRVSLVYNGDITAAKDLEMLRAAAPQVESVMIGRAAVANPALFRVLQGGNQLTLRELKEFHDRLMEAWLEDGLSPFFTVERMKTLWAYMQAMFPENRREVKAIMKSRTMDSFRSAVGTLLSVGSFQPGVVS